MIFSITINIGIIDQCDIHVLIYANAVMSLLFGLVMKRNRDTFFSVIVAL